MQKRRLMDGEAMEAMRQIMRSQAAFAGMEVLTYCFMSQSLSHLRAPWIRRRRRDLDDAGLVEAVSGALWFEKSARRWGWMRMIWR